MRILQQSDEVSEIFQSSVLIGFTEEAYLNIRYKEISNPL